MSITASELRTIGNARTGRSESQTTIDGYVKSWVNDLTLRGVLLEGEEDVTLTDEQPHYAESGFTNAYKKIRAITIIDDDDNESEPLEEISWQRYKERVAQGTDAGKPREYTRFNGYVYLWPGPDTDTYPTMRISGYLFHADSTTISYNERYRECGSQYIIFKIYESKGLSESHGKPHFILYESEIVKILENQAIQRKSNIRYTDI